MVERSDFAFRVFFVCVLCKLYSVLSGAKAWCGVIVKMLNFLVCKSFFLASRAQDCTALHLLKGQNWVKILFCWFTHGGLWAHTDGISDFPWFQSHLNPQSNMMPCGEKKEVMSKKILNLKSSSSPVPPLTGLDYLQCQLASSSCSHQSPKHISCLK